MEKKGTVYPEHVYRYIRNGEGVKFGMVVAVKHEDGIRIGISMCHDKDKFDREIGLSVAMGRALSSKGKIDMSFFPDPINTRKDRTYVLDVYVLPLISQALQKWFIVEPEAGKKETETWRGWDRVW